MQIFLGVILALFVFLYCLGGINCLLGQGKIEGVEYVIGFVTMLSIAHNICLPMFFEITICFVGSFIYYDYMFNNDSLCEVFYAKYIQLKRKQAIHEKILVLCCSIILLQVVWQCVNNVYMYADDFAYITMINDILETNTLYDLFTLYYSFFYIL